MLHLDFQLTIKKYIHPLFELGVFFIVINCICLSFMQIHTDFYSNYIIYFALLIFCCQDVATPEPYTILSPVQSLTQN